MRRLYVGGLSHSVTQKDLKDRFGKFGEVEDVEVRTRRDDEGVPYKTFGYININISDGDLKKCLTVLNKSKWKGGTLQIETAKESFLHRLAEERQATEEQRLQQPAAEDKRQKMLDSLSKAGVDNFTMKAAVPGTEVPGHKDWVVSKFGRVLPILQLRCQKGSRARTLKYDPSKYSHNIRKLDRSAANESTVDLPTPVTQLTWEVPGGDDDISKKRRGEFPQYEPPRRKKSRTDVVQSQKAPAQTRFKQTVTHAETHRVTNGYEPPAQRTGPRFTESDSDEEIRRIVESQNISHDALQQEDNEDNLEVVGFDYMVKSRHQKHKGGPDGEEEENDYDSADTDELFASRKPCPPAPAQESVSENKTNGKRKKKSKACDEEQPEVDEEHVASRKQQRKDSSQQSKKMKVLPINPPSSESDNDEDEELESTDSDYEAMFSHITHLEISLDDLQRLAEESQPTSETTAPSILGASSERETKLTPNPEVRPLKKGITPEEILAAIMEDDSSEDEQKRKKKKKSKGVVLLPLPAFQGTTALSERWGKDESHRRQSEEEEGGSDVRKQQLDSETSQLEIKGQKDTETDEESSESSEVEEEEEEEGGSDVKKQQLDCETPQLEIKGQKHSETDEESSEEEEEEKKDETDSSSSNEEEESTNASQTKAAASSSSSSSSTEEDEDELVINSTEEPPAPHYEEALPRAPLGAKEEEEQQRKANMRRLAAVQQRQKEAEEHKKLIQGALANLDAPAAAAGKHIVFGSDDEDEEEDGGNGKQTTSEGTASKKTLFQNSQSENENDTTEEKACLKPSGPQLFDASEDEEDADEDEDGSRFDIRPQFEGRAGQKLMELQSRFGTDERFKMDSRFLEEDEDKEEESERKKSATEEEEALDEERKKNLSILQSVLGSSQQTCGSKTAIKAKTFRDVSTLHYDPSREEHAAFETKTEETKKESKSARRKKREEAQKLPEVSKEIYYDVSGDLKAVFGPTKENEVADVVEDEEKKNWDQEEEEGGRDEQPTLSADPSAASEQESGFKFSFFGDDVETGGGAPEYKVESIQVPKVSWQQDLRFHDSSSDEEEQEEEEEQSSIVTQTAKEETPSKTDLLFFFYPEDSRLTDGPRGFCRSSHLEEQKEQWEERRSELRQEYRKKHKDARRKLKSSLKS